MREVPSYIAVIDDDSSICRALSRLLRTTGHVVRSYFSAEAFFDDQNHRHVCFVVADIQLGGMSGFDLQRKLLEEVSSVPFVFITAHDEPKTRAQAAATGCVAYLRKPFPGSLLIKAVRSALVQPPKTQ